MSHSSFLGVPLPVKYFVDRSKSMCLKIHICGAKRYILALKYSGGSVMMAIVDRKINSRVYQDFLQENLRTSVCQLRRNKGMCGTIGQWPKCTAGNHQQENMRLLGWPSGHEIESHTRCPKDIAKLKGFCCQKKGQLVIKLKGSQCVWVVLV